MKGFSLLEVTVSLSLLLFLILRSATDINEILQVIKHIELTKEAPEPNCRNEVIFDEVKTLCFASNPKTPDHILVRNSNAP